MKKEKHVHYMLELSYRITTWSLFLFFICLIVIISLEVGHITWWTMVCVLIDIAILWLIMNRYVVIRDNYITVHHALKKKRLSFSKGTEILIYKGFIVLKQEQQEVTLYLTKKQQQAFCQRLEEHHWQVTSKVEH